MARARNIKPSFFTNEALAEQPFEYRLLFIGLWTLADRDGRMEDRPKRIRMALFPADNVDVNKGLDSLARAGFITRYEVDGERYIEIDNFVKHQNPHHKEPQSTIPASDKYRVGHQESLGLDGDARDQNPRLNGHAQQVNQGLDGHECGKDTKQTLDEPQANPGLARGSGAVAQGSNPADSGFLIPDSPSRIPESHTPQPPPPNGAGSWAESFARFWEAWPKSPRKVEKARCLVKWRERKLHLIADEIIAHVEAMKRTRQWCDGYEPAPMTYLNGQRWLDGVPPDGPPSRGAPKQDLDALVRELQQGGAHA